MGSSWRMCAEGKLGFRIIFSAQPHESRGQVLEEGFYYSLHCTSSSTECNISYNCVALTDGPESNPLRDLIFAENLHAPGGGSTANYENLAGAFGIPEFMPPNRRRDFCRKIRQRPKDGWFCTKPGREDVSLETAFPGKGLYWL